MKGYFLGMIGFLLVAEGLPFLWFTEVKEDFVGIEPVKNVRHLSLEDERSGDLLNFDVGTNYLSDRGGRVTMTVMTWNTGNSHGLMDAFGHSPEVCLPVSGGRLLATLPVREVMVGEEVFEVYGWMFSHPLFEKNIHAYKLVHSSYPGLSEMGLRREMVKVRLSLFQNRRLMPTIEVAIGIVMGTNSSDEAWERFSFFLRDNFKLQKNFN